tara:strand:- start:914 stop:1135 length:222 start_codon:yes stop_codon:yes gene_type:complete
MKQKCEETVTVKFDFEYVFDSNDIDFDDKLEVIRSRVENKLSSMDAADIKNKIIFEVGAKFYYTDNNGCTTEI